MLLQLLYTYDIIIMFSNIQCFVFKKRNDASKFTAKYQIRMYGYCTSTVQVYVNVYSTVLILKAYTRTFFINGNFQ